MGIKSRIQRYLGISSRYDIPGTWNMMRDMDFFAYSGNGCDDGFCIDFGCHKGLDKAYRDCSTLSTVINRNSMAMANGKWWIVSEKDNDEESKYPNISNLLLKPNPIQTFTEFIIQLDVYRQLEGEVFVYAPTPVGYSVEEASALWVIHPRYIEIELSNKLYMQSNIDDIVQNYYLVIDGKRTLLDNEKLLHIRDINQNVGFCQTDIRGVSRLTGLELSIANIIQAEEALYSLNKDRGAFGILSNDREDKIGPMPITPLEKEQIHQQYNKQYGLRLKQAKAIITDAKLKWQPMSFNVKDLMLIEGMDKNIQLVASAFGYPYELLGVTTSSVINSNSGRFENQVKRMHYQDTIIPIANIYAEKFTSFFGLKNDEIIVDFDHIESLKTAESEAADTLYKKNQALHEAYTAGAISLEEYRLGLGYDEQVYGETMYSNGNEGN